MITDILAHPAYLRILSALRSRPCLRFSEIQSQLGLNPAQVDRALKSLRKGLFIIPTTVAAKGDRIRIVYRLGERGESFLQSFDVFIKDVKRRAPAIGVSEVRELQGLYR